MTKEERQMLLQDLSARLPYGVILNTPKGDGHLCSINQTIFGTEYGINIKATERDYFNDKEVCIKPYLRPMSSMTEEEMEELKALCSIYIPTDSPTIGFVEYGILVFTHHLTNNTYSFKLNLSVIDWLNAHHFDYRGLIEKGLAIAVTNENNPYSVKIV